MVTISKRRLKKTESKNKESSLDDYRWWCYYLNTIVNYKCTRRYEIAVEKNVTRFLVSERYDVFWLIKKEEN